jgi:hypothetical protein
MAALGTPRRPCLGRAWLAGLAAPWLLGMLLVASPAGAAHPPGTLGIAAAEADSAASGPALVESPPPVTPPGAALVCLALLALPVMLAARRWQRTATLATLGLLVWFSAEAAFHSAHHLEDSGDAARCPVFSAAHHLPGVAPEPVVPVLERPAPSTAAPLPAPAVAARVVLDGEQARAPPARPA